MSTGTKLMKLTKALISNLIEFYEQKKIESKINEIMDLIKPPHENDKQEISDDLTSLLDSLSNIKEIIHEQ